MDSKESFRLLVETVAFYSKKTNEQLATDMGYGKTYISEMLSPTGKLSQKFIRVFREKYKEYLEKPSSIPVAQQPVSISVQDYIDELKKDKADLKEEKAVYLEVIKTNLASINTSIAKLVEIHQKVNSEPDQSVGQKKKPIVDPQALNPVIPVPPHRRQAATQASHEDSTLSKDKKSRESGNRGAK